MASPDTPDDYEWQPPTEAEMKIIQARRERSDKISKLMGDYLLKGYKMLGITCPQCSTIIMQDKQGKNYCVACNELDADGNKDDPALSREAARRQVAEERERSSGSPICTPDSPSTSLEGFEPADKPPPPPPRPGVKSSAHSTTVTPSAVTTSHNSSLNGASRSRGLNCNVPTSSTQTVIIQSAPNTLNGNENPTSSSVTMDVSQPIGSVKTKLHWACTELDRTSSVEAGIQLCRLIKSCADALISLQTLHSNPSQSG